MFVAYKKALDKTIDGETDGDFGKLLLEILKVGKNDWLHVKMVLQFLLILFK